MAEKDTILKEKIQHSGILDFKGLYEYAYGWLTGEGYFVTEEKYSEKISGSAKEIEIIWVATKTLSDYFKVELTVQWLIINMTDVEVEIDGKKKKMNKAVQTILKNKGVLVKDWQSTWESSAFSNFLRNVYDKYVIPARISQMEDKVVEDVQDFNGEIKAFLELTGRR